MNALESMKAIRFGIEIETVGASRWNIAAAISRALSWAPPVREGGYYDKITVAMPDGRKWTMMSDASLSRSSLAHLGSCEIVSPILTYADLEALQSVVRAARTAGAKVDTTCGIHVHVDASPFDTNGLVRLAKLVYQQEDLLIAALGAQDRAAGQYTKRMDESFIRRLLASRPADRQALAACWYGNVYEARSAASQHYHNSRYHGLNLHSVNFRGTVEFRYFSGSLHAGEVKTYIQLCLAIAAKAITSKSALARKRALTPATAKYDVRVFLLRLKMIGDDFKTARFHLLKRLEGSAAWKNGRPTPVPPAELQACSGDPSPPEAQ